MAKVGMPKLAKDLMPVFSDEDVTRLLAVCDTYRDRAMVMFLLDTGVRASEMAALNVEDVDMDSGTVKVRLGKGQKSRVTFASARTLKQIARYLTVRRGEAQRLLPASPLWLSAKRGQRLTYSGMMQFARRLKKRSGVDPCTCHMFRRYFAVKSLRNGMDVFHLQQIGGWEDMQTMKRYIILAGKDLEEAVKKYGVVNSIYDP